MELDVVNDIAWDGFFLGAADSSDSNSPSQLLPVEPNNGKAADETVYLVNGIMTDVQIHRGDMQSLANTGKNVIGVHNATAGLVSDLAQCLDDKAGTGFSENKATASTQKLIMSALDQDQPIHLVAHSQGAIVVVNAVEGAREELARRGYSLSELERKLEDVRVTTFGGAARFYPDGPSYTHVINRSDLVPMGTGLGLLGYAGRGAVVHDIDVVEEPHDLPEARASLQNWLARYVDRTTHGPQDIYFNHAPWA